MALIDIANPTRFLAFTARLLPWLGIATAVVFAIGLYLVWFAPDDYQQGATVKIMFIHVPNAWLSMAVWGVMSTFAAIASSGSATLTAMAPGVSAALITTVAGLLVAIPSMVAYNYLVHNLRVFTVELDNFAQELISKVETEYLADE